MNFREEVRDLTILVYNDLITVLLVDQRLREAESNLCNFTRVTRVKM